MWRPSVGLEGEISRCPFSKRPPTCKAPRWGKLNVNIGAGQGSDPLHCALDFSSWLLSHLPFLCWLAHIPFPKFYDFRGFPVSHLPHPTIKSLPLRLKGCEVDNSINFALVKWTDRGLAGGCLCVW